MATVAVVVEGRTQRCDQSAVVRRVGRQVGQVAEEKRHVGLGAMQRFDQVLRQCIVAFSETAQAQFVGHDASRAFAIGSAERGDAGFKIGTIRNQRRQGARQSQQIPLHHFGLAAITVAAALGIGGVRGPAQVVAFEPAVGAVIDGQAEDGHVVRVHYAMDKADAHPLGHHDRTAAADLLEPACIDFGAGHAEFRVVGRDHVIGEAPELIRFIAPGEDLEIAETHEGGRDATDDGAGLVLGIAVVEHVPFDGFAGTDQAQGPRRRYAEVMHGFAAEEFAQRRAQHGATVAAPRIGRAAGTLQLQFAALAVGADQFDQRQGAAVAQLSRPVAELVAAVTRGIGLHAG